MKQKTQEEIKQEMFDEILSDFDFETVQRTMEDLGITFPNEPGEFKKGRHTPTVEELEAEAKERLEEAWQERMKWPTISEENRVTGLGGWCGHMMIDIMEDSFDLQFIAMSSASFFIDHQGESPETKLMNAIWGMFERNRGGVVRMSQEFIDENPDVVEFVKERYDVTLKPKESEE